MTLLSHKEHDDAIEDLRLAMEKAVSAGVSEDDMLDLVTDFFDELSDEE